MQASRLLAILLRLQTEGRVSAQALSQDFEVSVRTIYRDIDSLSAAGVPVYARVGRSGGFELRDGYRTRLTGLDRPEAESLLLAGVPFAAAQLGLGPALTTMRMKLLAALPEPAQRDAQRVASRFHLDPVAWYQGPDEPRLLPELATAVWAQQTLRLRYDSWKGVVERSVVALGLVLKAGLWYLVAAANGQARTYRVGSIVAIEVEAAALTAPPRFDLQRYWKTFTSEFEARLRTGSARVRARPAGLKALAQLNHATAQAVAQAGPAGRGGWQTLDIPVESTAHAVADLLRLAPDVQALGPPALRRALRQAAMSLHSLYGSTPKRRAKL